MLRITKTVNLNGQSVVGDDNQQAAYFSAVINPDAANNPVSTNMTIANEAIYSANKAAVRADYAAFTAAVYEAEDALGE
ncbi:MAG: hypothetical protein QM689_04350 [Oscillospiraceae bacterium]